MELLLFTKMLKRVGGCTVAETADRVSELGFDGADLTVRPGGHVEPSAVADRLPAAVETFAERGLSVPLITTQVTSPADDHAREVFETADACGVEFVKLGYWLYGGFGSIRDDVRAMRSDLDEIASLSREYDVTPTVHVHSGDYVTGDATLLREALREYEPDELGAYIDPGHMAVEGADSGWELGMDLLAPHTQLVAAKDFGLYPQSGSDGAPTTWERRTVPFSEGLVPWEAVLSNLDEMEYDGPISMHAEYHVDDLSELLDLVEADVEYLHGVADRTGLDLG